MTPNEYQEACRRTHPSFEQDLQTEKRCGRSAILIHAQLGISNESGEIADAIKKHLVYGQQLDRENIKEELGDLMWYISLMCDVISCSIEGVLSHNIDKLRIRYPEKFTEELAKERLDKQQKCRLCDSSEHTLDSCPEDDGYISDRESI